MKRRVLYGMTVGLIFVLAVFGAVKRKSYTNLLEEENYLEQLYVAELPKELAIASCDDLKKNLLESSIVLRVLAEEDVEHLFGASRQKVRIQEVYTGDNLQAGDEIFLYSRHWSVSMSADVNSLERGFVNIMDVGTEYLVFAMQQVEDIYGDIPVYELYDEALIAPVFCCEERSNVIFPTDGETTYVPYTKVQKNEFFSESEEGIQAWEELKKKMLATYLEKS